MKRQILIRLPLIIVKCILADTAHLGQLIIRPAPLRAKFIDSLKRCLVNFMPSLPLHPP